METGAVGEITYRVPKLVEVVDRQEHELALILNHLEEESNVKEKIPSQEIVTRTLVLVHMFSRHIYEIMFYQM